MVVAPRGDWCLLLHRPPSVGEVGLSFNQERPDILPATIRALGPARQSRVLPPPVAVVRSPSAWNARAVMEMSFDDVMETVVRGFEVGGVAILVVGSLSAFVTAALSYPRIGGRRAYEGARRNVGRAILLGLEFLIIADIVMTITVDPTLTSAAALGVIVLVRTFLSFSLEVELEGSLPWRRGATGELDEPSRSD